MTADLLIVGAGVAGLSLARALAGSELAVTVLEKSRGVGGRCATRRVEGQAVDHGAPFLHGQSLPFVQALGELEATSDCTPLRDWPYHLRGPGLPCQPQAFQTEELRLAIAQGVSCFPKQLARGTRVQLETQVLRLEEHGAELIVHTSEAQMRAPRVVLSCPVDQALPLLEPLAAGSRELQAVIQILRLAPLLPCLTVLAGYEQPPPADLHLLLPGSASPIHSLIHDSSKRPQPSQTVLVLQAQPAYSRQQLEAPEQRWRTELLAAAAALLGRWASEPRWCQTHRWRFARVPRGQELRQPVLIELPSGAQLGLCGDAFHPAGGVEGAYLSGQLLAGRILTQDATSDGGQRSTR